jgi:hypothetical protein
MNPIYLTAIFTALIVSTIFLSIIIKPAKLIPFILSIYFAVIVLITR